MKYAGYRLLGSAMIVAAGAITFGLSTIGDAYNDADGIGAGCMVVGGILFAIDWLGTLKAEG
jgi:hypothetical protein